MRKIFSDSHVGLYTSIYVLQYKGLEAKVSVIEYIYGYYRADVSEMIVLSFPQK